MLCERPGALPGKLRHRRGNMTSTPGRSCCSWSPVSYSRRRRCWRRARQHFAKPSRRICTRRAIGGRWSAKRWARRRRAVSRGNCALRRHMRCWRKRPSMSARAGKIRQGEKSSGQSESQSLQSLWTAHSRHVSIRTAIAYCGLLLFSFLSIGVGKRSRCGRVGTLFPAAWRLFGDRLARRVPVRPLPLLLRELRPLVGVYGGGWTTLTHAAPAGADGNTMGLAECAGTDKARGR